MSRKARAFSRRAEDASRGRGGALEIGLDPARFEVLTRRPDGDAAAIARLTPYMDIVLTDRFTREAWAERVSEEHVVRYLQKPRGWPLGAPLRGPVAIRITRPRHPAVLSPVDLRGAALLASGNAQQLPALIDQDPSTGWTAGEAPDEPWLEVRFDGKTPAAVVELRVVERSPEAASPARLQILGPDGSLLDTPVVDARPTFAEQRFNARRGSTRPFGQRLVLDGSPILGLRLAWPSARREGWTVSGAHGRGRPR